MHNKIFLNCCKYAAMICGMLFLTSCSVFMAADKNGVSIEELSVCRTRECLLAKGATPISSEKNASNASASEVFKSRKPTGSTARAVMHGVLDLSTGFIWEIIGTPIELTLNKEEMYLFKVLYKNNSNEVKAVQLAN
jgi:hypothetical protein